MAAGNFNLYSAATLSLMSAGINLSSDNFSVILLTNAYTPAADTHALYSDVSAAEVVTGNGYTVGGLSLTGVTWTRSGATCTYAAQSAVWPGTTISARYAAIVRRAGVSLTGTDKLLGYMDLTGSGNQSTTAATWQVNWNNSSTPSSSGPVFTVAHTP
jgi:hypothetical protein